MLPVLEDQRPVALAERTTTREEGTMDDRTPDYPTIQDLLKISSVYTVGIGTVPIPGNADVGNVTSLILDVAILAGQ